MKSKRRSFSSFVQSPFGETDAARNIFILNFANRIDPELLTGRGVFNHQCLYLLIFSSFQKLSRKAPRLSHTPFSTCPLQFVFRAHKTREPTTYCCCGAEVGWGPLGQPDTKLGRKGKNKWPVISHLSQEAFKCRVQEDIQQAFGLPLWNVVSECLVSWSPFFSLQILLGKYV